MEASCPFPIKNKYLSEKYATISINQAFISGNKAHKPTLHE